MFSLLETMDMGSWVHLILSLSLIYGDHHVIDKVHTIVMFNGSFYNDYMS